jgi:hypothetical protein
LPSTEEQRDQIHRLEFWLLVVQHLF